MRHSPTRIVVGGLIGLALAVVAVQVAGLKMGLMLLGLLIYEGWTLINPFPNDTISEIIWEFAHRPMVPYIFGVGTGWAVTSGYVSDPWLLVALGFLMGHFFFQRYDEE